MPSLRATASAVARLSPVSITMRMFCRCKLFDRFDRGGFHRVGNGDQPGHASI